MWDGSIECRKGRSPDRMGIDLIAIVWVVRLLQYGFHLGNIPIFKPWVSGYSHKGILTSGHGLGYFNPTGPVLA